MAARACAIADWKPGVVGLGLVIKYWTKIFDESIPYLVAIFAKPGIPQFPSAASRVLGDDTVMGAPVGVPELVAGVSPPTGAGAKLVPMTEK